MNRNHKTVVAALLPVAAIITTAPSVTAAPLRAERLRCEYKENPVGIDAPKPRLSWRLASDERGQGQTAYQILAASSEALLKENRGDLWDTGRVASGESLHIPYSGTPLRSGQRVWWKVRVWDRDGKDRGFSRPAYFEMGLLSAADWKAEWVGVPTADTGSGFANTNAWIWHPQPGAPPRGQDFPTGERYFRRSFPLPAGAKIGAARLTLTADDQFTVWVNGREVGRSTDKTDAWRTPLTLDVAPFLTAGGENVIAVAARNTGQGPAGLIARLRVELPGVITGPIDLGTDQVWRSSATASEGWQTAAFDDFRWTTAREVARFGQAPWGRVGATGTGPGRYLRRAFAVDRPVRRARLYMTALGIYEPYLNGRRVGQDVFAPGWTDYKKRVQYQTYDVTDLVRQGQNALGLTLADGWYAGHVGLAGRGVYGSEPLACGVLHVEYADGTRQTVGTDSQWRGTSAGPVVATDLLMGETYDARREMRGWAEPGFDDRAWKPVQMAAGVATPPREAERGPAVRRQEELAARTVSVPKPGTYVFDMGQNMVGWARLKVRGAAGAKVTLRFAEMLNPDGTLYTTNYRGARCTDEYILRGDARGETFEPHFTFRGFRYVEVTGWPGPDAPGKGAITGVVVHSEMPVTGRMETSSPLVNQLLKNIDWGQRGNYLSVPTDCPQRDERLGWTGDAQIFVRAATYNRDVAGFFDKWLVDLDDAQSPAGAYPDVAPRVAAGAGTAAWGDAGVICPWTQYLVYGDRRFLEDHYPGMTRWVEYCRTNSKDLIRPAAGYGDWLSIAADTPKDVLATAYFAYSTQLVARAARALGRIEDAARYESLFGQIRDAFNTAFVTKDGRVKGETQTGYLLALRFGLLPDALRPAAARYLAADIAKRNTHLSTGFVGVGYLNPTLTDAGYNDVAYKLLLNDTFPSWGYSIRQGATTIWERWDGWTKDKGFQDPGMNSFNHYSFGSVGEWLYATVAGIDLDPARPGFRHIIVRPRPAPGLDYARAEYDSIRGPIKTDWRRENGRLTLDVTVPANTTATVWVPTGDAASVTEGDKKPEAARGVTFTRSEPGWAVYDVGSGRYRFASAVP
jgi:alpha-L-rhamnosidase